ncbi:SpoIIE family protein phosphatase [Alkalihalobacterium alkalinitrilicum]|uniref:SpoIIE family protein phosphatase n=1 Tax=Alkalihalobacterium alkalinitrilicum TaxID=427920 RepID=UPI000994D08D|nr:SpoIIE family protein phosphatase [Alkalihalobacterium alkalinitrilicum]
MDEQLNYAPCGFVTLTEEGTIITINQSLLRLLGYREDELDQQHIHKILTAPAQMFYQLYFFPLVKIEGKVEEMYLSLRMKTGEEIPILLNAKQNQRENITVIDCVFIPVRKRDEYENELLIAKKEAEAALHAKNQTNAELEIALQTLETKQVELVQLNKENQKYKLDTSKKLELARKIQETSLTDPIDNEHIEIQAYYKASSQLSGDIYGFYQIGSHRYGVMILDVMGHGISSALITMSLQSLFQRLISRGFTPEHVMSELDHYLHSLFHNNEETRHYCTAFYAVVDTYKEQIEYINAGHPPTLLQHANGEVDELSATSPPVGLLNGIRFQSKTLPYAKGSKLLLYTDGVEDPIEEDSRLRAILASNLDVPLSTLKEKLIAGISHEANAYHKNDDQCFILVNLK